MIEEDKRLTNSIVKPVLGVGIVEIVAAVLLMLLELGIMRTINEFVTIKDDGFMTVTYISSLVFGLVGTFFIAKMLLKQVYKNNSLKLTVSMFIAQILVFIVMSISGCQIIDQTVESLKEEESLKSVFYDKYAIEAIVWGFGYEEWKVDYIKALDELKNVWRKNVFIISSIYSISGFFGYTMAGIVLRNKNKDEINEKT